MDRCPTCQARLRDMAVCGRCQTDLSLSLAIEAAAGRLLQRGLDDWAAGDMAAAKQALDAALQLKRTPLASALRDFLTRTRGPAPARTGAKSADGHEAAEYLGL